MGTGDLLTIGELARRSGLSLKALRLYDARGLLVPDDVDPDTGYRYYAEAQVPRARSIALLRRLDMPLAQIEAVLGGPADEVADAVRTWWADRQRDLVERGPALDLALHTLATATGVTTRAGTASPRTPGGFGPQDVQVRDVPARRVATIRRHVDQHELVASFTADVLDLRRHLVATGARHGDEFWVLFHGAVGPDGDGPVETCVPYDGSADPAGPVLLREEPAHRVAQVPVTAADCRYPAILGAYVALEEWCTRDGREPAGAVREVYPVPWSDQGVVAYVALPLVERP